MNNPNDNAKRRRGGYISDPEPRGEYADQPPAPKADGGVAPSRDVIVPMTETEAAKAQVALGTMADDEEVSDSFADDLDTIDHQITVARYHTGDRVTVDTETLATVVEWATEMMGTFEPHQMDDHVADAVSELDSELSE